MGNDFRKFRKGKKSRLPLGENVPGIPGPEVEDIEVIGRTEKKREIGSRFDRKKNKET